MPAKNSRKIPLEGGYYHIYNRGVAKQPIFLDEQDYQVFLRFLKEYLLPLEHPDLQALKKLTPRRAPINCCQDVELLAYCLMPNHFHLLLKNLTKRGIEKFIRAFGINYSMYFNQKYDRVGPLYQGVYKAVAIEGDEQFVYISKYIHLNPRELLTRFRTLHEYSYSSYQNYLGERHQDWVHTNEILSFFSKKFPSLSYQAFVEEKETPFEEISSLLLDGHAPYKVPNLV